MFCPDCGSWNRGTAGRCVRCGAPLPAISNRADSQPDPAVTQLRSVLGARYRVMHRVGDGGMANVYYAVQSSIDSPVVIKVLHSHLARDAEMPTLLIPRSPGIFSATGLLTTDLKRDIPMYVELYLQGRLNLDDLVTQEIGIGDIDLAYEQLKRGEVVRSVITTF